MPVFEYIALDARGKRLKGSLDAENSRAARQKLRTQGVFPTEMHESAAQNAPARDITRFLQSDRISTKDLAVSTRQFATLSAAGLPVVNAIQALTEQAENVTLKRILTEVRERVEEGSSLAKAMGAFPKAFPRLYVNMVASGEASGTLDTVLENLASYLEAQIELRRKVSGALIYPALMLVVCSGVIVILLAVVVPRIVEIFKRQGAVLPLPTRIMITLSDAILNYWYVAILLALLGGYAFRWYYKTELGRSKVDRLLLRLPLYGSLFLKVSTARVARTLGALLQSGVGLLTGLEITRNIVSNKHIVRALEAAQEGVREGRSLARELQKSAIFPALLYHMVAVGEKSGELEGMLIKAGKAYESEVDATLSNMTRLIEPLMMIVVGLVVLAIVMSVLLPMVDLIDIVQK